MCNAQRVRAALWGLMLCLPLTSWADLTPADVVMVVPAERYGIAAAVTQAQAPGANGGTAMVLGAESLLSGALELAPGPYSLVLRMFAPAGDADGFFVEIAGTRTRRTAPIGHWGTVAFPFAVATKQQVPLTIIGQEPGLLLDDVALVKGTVKDDEADTTKLTPTGGGSVGAADLKRLQSGCRLRDLPPPLEASAPTVARESFETVPPGVSGEQRAGPGKTGQAVFLDMPDGRFDMPAAALGAMPMGTITWWVKPRPAAQVWSDQGWHYFLHGAPAEAGGVRLDLSRSPATQLQLTVSAGDRKESLALSTGNADLQQWHQLLVSWDFTGDRQFLWLMLDGKGMQSFFPRTFAPPQFASLQFGNTPTGADLPLLPMDGGLDEIRVSRQSIQPSLSQ